MGIENQSPEVILRAWSDSCQTRRIKWPRRSYLRLPIARPTIFLRPFFWPAE
ncbi:30S ribosomal protein S14 domain protein [Klebsiella pneumoniae 909957]|nr:30S ribosomal protein S14 domain protein [Klebsiella pneumoniae 909957]